MIGHVGPRRASPHDRLGDVERRPLRRRRRAPPGAAPSARRVGAARPTTCSSPAAPATASPRCSSPPTPPASRSRRCRPSTSPGASPRSRFDDVGCRPSPSSARSAGPPTTSSASSQLAVVLGQRETVGAMQPRFDMTVEWAFDRYSFGRPLASYQALKHRFADMKTWLEASHAITDAAAAAVADGDARRRRAGQRGQGLHRRVRRRAAAGLRADARRHRRHLRARPPPVPAPPHGDRRRLYGTPAEHRQRLTAIARARERRHDRHRRRHRPTSRTSRASGSGPARGSSENLPPRPAATASRCAARRTDEEELAEVARDRELQRMLFDAGLAGICVPTEYGGQGLTPAHQQVLNEELDGYEYPHALPGARPSRRARRCCSTSAPRSRSSATSPPS